MRQSFAALGTAMSAGLGFACAYAAQPLHDLQAPFLFLSRTGGELQGQSKLSLPKSCVFVDEWAGRLSVALSEQATKPCQASAQASRPCLDSSYPLIPSSLCLLFDMS